MEEITLMERLKDRSVAEVCNAIIDVAQDFSLKHCLRNDCQHVSSNTTRAADLGDSCGDLTLEQLLPDYQREFGELRKLMKEVLLSRGLKPVGEDTYNPDIDPVEWKLYATADEFYEKIVSS